MENVCACGDAESPSPCRQAEDPREAFVDPLSEDEGIEPRTELTQHRDLAAIGIRRGGHAIQRRLRHITANKLTAALTALRHLDCCTPWPAAG